MSRILSSIFVALLIGWALLDLDSLLSVAGTFLDVFMVVMQRLASAAQSAVNS